MFKTMLSKCVIIFFFYPWRGMFRNCPSLIPALLSDPEPLEIPIGIGDNIL